MLSDLLLSWIIAKQKKEQNSTTASDTKDNSHAYSSSMTKHEDRYYESYAHRPSGIDVVSRSMYNITRDTRRDSHVLSNRISSQL